MSFHVVSTIFRKELLDTLRDKRNLIAMLGVPILLYPAIFIFAAQMASLEQDRLDRRVSRIAVVGDSSGIVREWLEEIDQVAVVAPADPEASLEWGRLDAVVVVEGDVRNALAVHGSLPVEIRYDATQTTSHRASRRLWDGLDEIRKRLIAERLRAAGLVETFAEPLKLRSTNTAPAAKTTGSLLGMTLPMIMIVMLGLGAFYPAVDLTAGEKERGTFETLLATPASKMEIVSGKFLTVFCLSMITGLLNLGSMALTFALQLVNLRDLPRFELNLPPSTVLILFLTLIPLAFFISAVMMTLAVFARNYREAQHFVTPFFVVLLFPAAAAAMSGVKLGAITQFIPIANVALLFRELMVGQGTAEQVAAVLISTGAYALLALLLARSIFNREGILLAEERGVRLSFDRSAIPPRRTPTFGMAMFLYAVVMLLIFYVGTYVQTRDVISGLLITQWLLILVPVLLVLWYARVNFREALSLRAPRPAAVGGTFLITVAWLVLVVEISIWQHGILPMPEGMQEAFKEIFAGELADWGRWR
jgi:sodium transport system permease protein